MKVNAEEMERRVAIARKVSPYLNTQIAAFYIGLSASALAHMRCRSEGPPFHYHGRYVRYHIDDLDSYSRERKRSGTHRNATYAA